MGISGRRLLSTAAAATVTPFVHANSEPVAQWVDQIRDSLMDGQPGVEAALTKLMENPASLLSILGTPTKGGITPLYNDFQITILNIVWAPLMVRSRPPRYPFTAGISSRLGESNGKEKSWSKSHSTNEA